MNTAYSKHDLSARKGRFGPRPAAMSDMAIAQFSYVNLLYDHTKGYKLVIQKKVKQKM